MKNIANLVTLILGVFAAGCIASATDDAADAPAPAQGLVLNFHDVPLNAVLTYLSTKTGLIVVSDVDLKGKVSVVAEQTISTNEIVDLLGAQLARNHYAITLSGRTLTIMDAASAKTSALTPVMVNNAGPKQIPVNDQIVTEILPVHTLQPAQLVKDLELLIPAGDTVAANEAGNAIIMTASQKDVHRISEIMAALDSSAISDMEVFVLKYADAKSIASELKDIFQTSDSEVTRAGTQNNSGGPGGPFGGMGPPGFTGGGGDGNESTKTAKTRAVFVSDDQLNALVASAPPDSMSTISNMISVLDRPTQDMTLMKVFRLKHADPGEIADELSELFPSSSSGSGQNDRSMGMQFGSFQQQPSSSASQSTRMKRQSTVVVVADRRTQSVIVTASKDMLDQIQRVVKDLDQGAQGVKILTALDFGAADPSTVQEAMAGLFSSASSPSQNTTQTATPLANRYTGNANSQTTSAQSTSTSSSSSSGGSSGAPH